MLALNSNLNNNVIKLTSIVVTAEFTTLGSVSDSWIPICVYNGDWVAYPNLAFDLIIDNGSYKAVARNFGATTGGYRENSAGVKRLNIVWINKKYDKA